jgi:hypothetical protein
LDFLDFEKGKWKEKARDILNVKINGNSDSVTISIQQERFLLCDMLDPKEWINNAIQMKANRLIKGIK